MGALRFDIVDGANRCEAPAVLVAKYLSAFCLGLRIISQGKELPPSARKRLFKEQSGLPKPPDFPHRHAARNNRGSRCKGPVECRERFA